MVAGMSPCASTVQAPGLQRAPILWDLLVNFDGSENWREG